MAIRYDKKLNSEIRKAVLRFNKKVRSLEQNENIVNVSTTSKKELIKGVNTRKELRKKLADLKRFSKTGAENIVELPRGERVSNWQILNIRAEIKRAKLSIGYQIRQMEKTKVKVAGKEQDVTIAQMGREEYHNLLAQRRVLNKAYETLSYDEAKQFEKMLIKVFRNKVEKDKILKDNYKEMLFDLAYFTNYDNEKIKLISDKLDKLSITQFKQLFNSDEAIRQILDYYMMMNGLGKNPRSISREVSQLYDILIENLENL